MGRTPTVWTRSDLLVAPATTSATTPMATSRAMPMAAARRLRIEAGCHQPKACELKRDQPSEHGACREGPEPDRNGPHRERDDHPDERSDRERVPALDEGDLAVGEHVEVGPVKAAHEGPDHED